MTSNGYLTNRALLLANSSYNFLQGIIDLIGQQSYFRA
jgi:hypothetical protein